ncbi:hypothetical protein SERLADRAFT_380103, partial [Serpula lacrymans var. lacrymans S7.9]
MRAISSSLSKRTPSNIEISSITNVLTCRHRSTTFLNLGCPRNFPASLWASSWPRPIPAQECNVVPPILTDAIPVDAVIASSPEERPPHIRMISL